MNHVPKIGASFLFVLVVATASSPAQTANDDALPRMSISGGLGVNYHNAQDIVNRINGSGVLNRRLDDFKSGVEFFGTFGVPLSSDWEVKIEYVYFMASYSEPTSYGGNAEFSYAVHMPTLIGQYILHHERTYNFKAGAGVGYHFGTYAEKYALVDGTFTARGVGALLELEGNTALGEDIFAHFGTQARWDFVGNLTNASGRSPSGTPSTSLHFFSVGARLGVTVYL